MLNTSPSGYVNKIEGIKNNTSKISGMIRPKIMVTVSVVVAHMIGRMTP
jgi:hypothetical protein